MGALAHDLNKPPWIDTCTASIPKGELTETLSEDTSDSRCRQPSHSHSAACLVWLSLRTVRAACRSLPSTSHLGLCRLGLRVTLSADEATQSCLCPIQESAYRKRYRGSPHGRCRADHWQRTCRRRVHAWARWDLRDRWIVRVRSQRK